MDDITKGLLIGGAFSLMTVLLPALINWGKTKSEAKKIDAESDGVDADTIAKLRVQINSLVTDNIALNEKIEDIKQENRKWRNGFARAVRYIHEKNPDEPIPDFLFDTPIVSKLP